MKKLLTSDKVYIGESRILNAGRGVFARRDIKKGEIIERCPIIEVSKHDTSNLKESILVTYFFYFGKNMERLAIVLGFGSIYNHSYKPNARFKTNQKEKIIDFIALNDIKKGNEITFNYYNSKNSKDKKSPLWFEVDLPSKVK
ncbi:MAG: SET domain-containing protein-lysine N-methyltransferase [Patescibacteria group bacterium]